MKRLKFLGKLMSFLLLAVAMVTVSCARRPDPTPQDNSDSVLVVKTVESIVNPEFTSVQNVLTFRNSLLEENTINEMFVSMPEDLLLNVATVCLKKNATITKKDIILEYRANRQVYDNLFLTTLQPEKLTPTGSENVDKPTAMEEQRKPVVVAADSVNENIRAVIK